MQNNYEIELKILGQKIKMLRESKKMTQQKLADVCEIDIRTIQRIEIGEYGSGLPVIFAIAEAFEISASQLLDLN